MVVPNFRGPGYAAEQGAVLGEGSAARLASMLKNRELETDVIKSTMQNAERVANVAGSGALDKIAQGYAGATDPLYGGAYADVMDKLRTQKAQADIAATGRSNAGGKGKDTSLLKSDTMVVKDKNTGLTSVIKTTGMDTAFLAGLVSGSNPQYQVVSMGTPLSASTSSLPAGAPEDDNTETIDGIKYDLTTGQPVE